MRLVLFDIDGTLLYANGLGSAGTRLAMQEVFGTTGKLDEFTFGGKTDWQMLLETLRDHIPAAEIERRLPEYDRVLEKHIHTLAGDFGVNCCPGAPELLSRTLEAPNVLVGILTANMPRTAHLKLRAAGYDPHDFDFGVYGSEAPTRTGLAPIALQRARNVLRRDIAPEDTLFIGDTPDDIACARSIGAQIIAVATGRHSSSVLAKHEPTIAVEDLTDIDALWEIISGNAAG